MNDPQFEAIKIKVFKLCLPVAKNFKWWLSLSDPFTSTRYVLSRVAVRLYSFQWGLHISKWIASSQCKHIYRSFLVKWQNIHPLCLICLPVIRQLNTSIAVSSLTSGQCRLAPLIQVIQDCSQLYHFNVKLLFKLHACKADCWSQKCLEEWWKCHKRDCTCFTWWNYLGPFQVSLLTLYKDTVTVSMSSFAGECSKCQKMSLLFPIFCLYQRKRSVSACYIALVWTATTSLI